MSDEIRQCLEQPGSLQVLAVTLLGRPLGRGGGTGRQQAGAGKHVQKKALLLVLGHTTAACCSTPGVPDQVYTINQNLHCSFSAAL